MLIRWQVQRGWVAIPKSVTPSRIATNIAVSHFALSADEMATLAALDKGQRLIKGLPFLFREGMHWSELWDEDWVRAGAGGSGGGCARGRGEAGGGVCAARRGLSAAHPRAH